MTNDNHELVFHESLEETDFGLIICGKTGVLKGIWVPSELENFPIPDKLVRICVDVFGIDESEFEGNDDDLGSPPTDSIH